MPRRMVCRAAGRRRGWAAVLPRDAPTQFGVPAIQAYRFVTRPVASARADAPCNSGPQIPILPLRGRSARGRAMLKNKKILVAVALVVVLGAGGVIMAPKILVGDASAASASAAA